MLLHGSGSNAITWLHDVATWARRFRVYAVDLVGEPGLSAPSRPPLEAGVHAAWLDEVLDGLGADRVSLAGMSLGGWVALAHATRRPDRVERLALLCPGGLGRRRQVPLLGALALRALGGSYGRRQAMRIILGPYVPTGDQAAELGEFMLLIHRSFRPRLEEPPVFPDDDLRRLTMPVLVIAGVIDNLIDSRDVQRRAARTMPAADVRLLPGIGHLLPAQTGPIMDFLETAHA